MKGEVLKQIDKQLYLVKLKNGKEVEAYIGLKPLVMVFGGQLEIGKIVRIDMNSRNQATISPRDSDSS
ncbi:hypothetical protein BKI52_19125 [marine bacterium AO1-C]|nr:hypothetical protein BKI52_19125 [marine bacterium AO1-C]